MKRKLIPKDIPANDAGENPGKSEPINAIIPHQAMRYFI